MSHTLSILGPKKLSKKNQNKGLVGTVHGRKIMKHRPFQIQVCNKPGKVKNMMDDKRMILFLTHQLPKQIKPFPHDNFKTLCNIHTNTIALFIWALVGSSGGNETIENGVC